MKIYAKIIFVSLLLFNALSGMAEEDLLLSQNFWVKHNSAENSTIASFEVKDDDKPRKLVPPPTNRNFALVAAPLSGVFMDGGFGYTAQFSGHFFKPRFALDFYYESAWQDLRREKMIDPADFVLIENFYKRLEFNFSYTFSSKIGSKNSLFYDGTVYQGGSAYETYKSGSGDAAKYRQLRLGVTSIEFILGSKGLDSLPRKHENLNVYYYDPKSIILINNNLCFHVGLGFSKVYQVESPGRRNGIDRIGNRKMYFDFFYAPHLDYEFFEEDGNSPFSGYLLSHIAQNAGGRFGWEVIRLNPFSGYYLIEIAVRPGMFFDTKNGDDGYAISVGMKFGLATGWPLFNWNYE